MVSDTDGNEFLHFIKTAVTPADRGEFNVKFNLILNESPKIERQFEKRIFLDVGGN